MGAIISKRGSYRLKEQEEKQEKLLINKLRKSYSVISLSEAKIYGDESDNDDDAIAHTTVVVNTVDPRAAIIKEIKDRIAVSKRLSSVVTDNDDDSVINTIEEDAKTPEIQVESNVRKEKELENVGPINTNKEDIRTPEVQTVSNDEKILQLEDWKDHFNDEFWKTGNESVKKECEDQIVVKDSNEEQTEIINDEQQEVIQEDNESLITDINTASNKIISDLKNIQNQLEPICEEYLEVQTNQSKNETISNRNKYEASAFIISSREEQIEVPQVDSNNFNGDSITDLNLEVNDEPQAPEEIKKNTLTKTISANSELSYKSIHNSDVESNASDTFYDADDQESANNNEYYDDEQLEVWEGKLVQDTLIFQQDTNDIIECVNKQTKNEVFENIGPVASPDNSIIDAQIEVFDEIKPTKEINESDPEAEPMSLPESMDSLAIQEDYDTISNFDEINATKEIKESEREEEPRSLPESMNSSAIQENFDTISNFSMESKNSSTDVENSSSETTESVQAVKVDDDTSHEIDIKFQITEKLSQVEKEKNEIEIENYLSIERDSENQLDESTAEIAAVSNEITKVTEENSENLNLEQTTAENTNKSINESFSNHTLHESCNIIESNDNLLNNSEVKNVASSETVNFENSEEIELTPNSNIDEEVEIIISQINTVIGELNYLKERIDSLTSEMHEEHNISEMYQALIKLMRNVNAIKYSDFNEKIINLQHEAVDKIHDCLTQLKSVQAAKEQI